MSPPSAARGASVAAALERALGGLSLRRDVPLAPLTTFRIGGPADFYAQARSAGELAAAVTAGRRAGLPTFVLGLGANILVGDGGFRGLVVHNLARGLEVSPGGWVTAESGVVFHPDLIEAAVARGLSGLEHFAGIPTTVGGALWQNLHFLSPAPARERTVFIAEVLASADLLTAEGQRRSVGADYFEFGYDCSILHRRSDVVLTATFALQPGDPERLRTVVAENLAWRSERHPPLASEPSAGSVFKKVEGVGAGRLIDRCGLKGFRVGRAEVSRRHANFIVNCGGASAADVRTLITRIQEVVLARTGRMLEPEISFVGEP